MIAKSKLLTVEPLSAGDPEIGRWLWALQDVRRSTLNTVAGCCPELLDWPGPDGQENSIGSLLYHLAIVEMSWIYLDIQRQKFPHSVRRLLPWPMGEDGRMTQVAGSSLAEHIERLASTREITVSVLDKMDLQEWRRPRFPVDESDYQATPEWAVFHLIEHEAGHSFQIKSLTARWKRLAMPG